jgi:signal peptidase I
MFGLVVGLWWVVTFFFGVTVNRVASGSMEPMFQVGSEVIVVKTSDPAVNDVITFHNPATGKLTTHIFGGYAPDGTLRTKGMANEDPDAFYPAPRKSDIVGKVVAHTEVFTASFWQSMRGIGVGIMAVVIVLLMFVYRSLGRGEKTVNQGTPIEREAPASNPV